MSKHIWDTALDAQHLASARNQDSVLRKIVQENCPLKIYDVMRPWRKFPSNSYQTEIIWSSDAWKRGDNCDENEEIGHREWKKWGIEQTKLLKNPRGSGLISPQCRVEQGIQIKTFMLGFCITYQRSCYLWWKFFV